jgi:membrane associated rhomboid family serine protease
MGLYDRPYYRDEVPRGYSLPGARSMVTNLIIINVAIYILDAIFLGGRLSRLLSVEPESLRQPWNWWKLLTYGFAHDPNQVWHIIGNMIGLFFFGRDIEAIYGRRSFLGMYLTALLLGSVMWSLRESAFSVSQTYLVGASGAITSVIILFALHYPRRTVYLMFVLPIPAWVLGVFLVLSNIWSLGDDRLIAYDVHLVGAAYGFLFYKTRWELGQLFSDRWMSRLKSLRPRPKLRVHAPVDPTSRYRELDAQADAVLAKLHREGEASLSAKERKILEDYSRRMQQKHR